jgi:hypothetical protein
MFNTHSAIEVLLILAGAGQLALALSSLAIPYLLDWREELQCLKPLTRSVFRTYSMYTFGTNVWFGVMSIAAAGPLAAGGLLARLVTGFITLYWGMRIVVQFAVYDRSVAKERLLFRFAEIAYVLLFVSLTLIFGYVTLRSTQNFTLSEGGGRAGAKGLAATALRPTFTLSEGGGRAGAHPSTLSEGAARLLAPTLPATHARSELKVV